MAKKETRDEKWKQNIKGITDQVKENKVMEKVKPLLPFQEPMTDPLGSWTGAPTINELPTQDADDL